MEYNYDFSPAWRFVVRHMHWTERMEAIGELYLRSAFGVESDVAIPPVSDHKLLSICRNAPLIDM